MGRFHGRARRRWLTAIAVAAALTLAGTVPASQALATGSAISGVVEDTSGTPQADVTVNVLDPATAATVTSTTTANDGTFSVLASSGSYNVQFIPPSSDGLQSYLATGVSTDSAPLTIILKAAVVVQVQGSLKGGNYSASLFADQNFTLRAVVNTPGTATFMIFNNLPVGTLDHSQTYNVVLPTAQLTVSVRDASGNPITGGTLQLDSSTLSTIPGLPGASASTFGFNGATLDAHGNTTIAVPDGITLNNTRIILSNGLIIPFTLHPITGDRHAYIIFDEATGTVLVNDQPPAVTGSPDRAPNANGWYNAPVTITWSSTDPAPSHAGNTGTFGSKTPADPNG